MAIGCCDWSRSARFHDMVVLTAWERGRVPDGRVRRRVRTRSPNTLRRSTHATGTTAGLRLSLAPLYRHSAYASAYCRAYKRAGARAHAVRQSQRMRRDSSYSGAHDCTHNRAHNRAGPGPTGRLSASRTVILVGETTVVRAFDVTPRNQQVLIRERGGLVAGHHCEGDNGEEPRNSPRVIAPFSTTYIACELGSWTLELRAFGGSVLDSVTIRVVRPTGSLGASPGTIDIGQTTVVSAVVYPSHVEARIEYPNTFTKSSSCETPEDDSFPRSVTHTPTFTNYYSVSLRGARSQPQR